MRSYSNFPYNLVKSFTSSHVLFCVSPKFLFFKRKVYYVKSLKKDLKQIIFIFKVLSFPITPQLPYFWLNFPFYIHVYIFVSSCFHFPTPSSENMPDLIFSGEHRVESKIFHGCSRENTLW